MRLLSVLMVLALCNGLMAMPRESPMSHLLAIEGPLYVDSASLFPATLTRIRDERRNNFNLPHSFSRSNHQNDFNPNKRLFSSVQAQTMMNRLLRIQNDPQLNFEFDRSAFAQNNPLQLNQNAQNDQLKRFILFNQLQNPYTQNDIQFDHMNAQNDQLRNLMQNFQFDSLSPQERILRVFAIPVSVTVPGPVQNPNTFNDATQNSPFSQLDQLNAQIDFLHQQRLNQINARQQNDAMQWLQNQQFQQHNPYTQNVPLQTNQLGQFNPQNDLLQNHQFNQLRAQNDPTYQLFQHHRSHQQNVQNFNDFVAAQNAHNFHHNPVFMMPDEDHDEQQLQGFGTNFQGDQFQNFLQNSQQQDNQQQNFLSDESSNDSASENQNDDDY